MTREPRRSTITEQGKHSSSETKQVQTHNTLSLQQQQKKTKTLDLNWPISNHQIIQTRIESNITIQNQN